MNRQAGIGTRVYGPWQVIGEKLHSGSVFLDLVIVSGAGKARTAWHETCCGGVRRIEIITKELEKLVMENYIQTTLGIFASVVLFLIGYRQTIGAKKERIKNANEKIVETLLRRIILENYKPKKEEITRIVEGKARDYRVNAKDLLSIPQILNTIYTRIFENDLITKEVREASISIVSDLFVEEQKTDKKDLNLPIDKPKSKLILNLTGIVLALLSSLIGVSLVSFNELFTENAQLNWSYLLAFALSFAAIAFVYLFIRIKDNQESTEKVVRTASTVYSDFEREVFNVIRKLDMTIEIPDQDNAGYDIALLKKETRVIIEIKVWSMFPPLSILRRIILKFESAIEKTKANEGIIVLPDKVKIPTLNLDKKVKILALNELSKYLANRYLG